MDKSSFTSLSNLHSLILPDPNATRLLHYLTRKLAEHLDSLEHALDHMDAQGDANAVDLEYNRELLRDADNCLHGVLWIMDETDEDCGKNEAADVLAATRTLRWLGGRHNVERVGGERPKATSTRCINSFGRRPGAFRFLRN